MFKGLTLRIFEIENVSGRLGMNSLLFVIKIQTRNAETQIILFFFLIARTTKLL